MKIYSVSEIFREVASPMIDEVDQEPVMLLQDGKAVAWLISARQLAQVATKRSEQPDIYEGALVAIAVHLYEQEILTLGQAAQLVELDLGDFINRCADLGVPVLWKSDGGVRAEVNAFEV